MPAGRTGATIEVTLRSGDTIVRQFIRYCPENTAEIQRVASDAAGWLQAWAAQLSDEQWHADARAQQRQVA